MLFTKSTHAKNLPVGLTSHQVGSAAEGIHKIVKQAVDPLVESRPEYYALQAMLASTELAMNQLREAHMQRKYKATVNLRGVGGLEGKLFDTISQQKRAVHRSRSRQVRLIRMKLKWYVMLTDGSPEYQAARLLKEIIDLRIDGFEYLSYAESEKEVDYLIFAIDASEKAVDAQAAIQLLKLADVYAKLKSDQSDYKLIIESQTLQDNQREAKPKVRTAVQELRQAIRALLTTIHFDVANGNKELEAILGHIDEVIDKVRTVATRRETISEQEKAKAADKQKQQADQADQTDQSDAPADNGGTQTDS